MATFKCKICDAVLNVREGTSIYVCEYCGTKQTVPMDGDFDSGHNEKHESVSVGSLLKRAFMFLEDGKWVQAKQYCERALDIDPENGRAYLGNLMAEINVHSESELSDPCLDYRNNDNYIKVLRFGDPQTVNNLKAYAIESAYKMALKIMNSAVHEKDYYQAAKQFRAVAGYKYADERAVKCEELAKEKAVEEEKQQFRKKIYYIIYMIVSILPGCTFIFTIWSTYDDSYVVGIFCVVIMSLVDVLSIFYSCYLYHFIGSDEQNRNQDTVFGVAIVGNFITSCSITFTVNKMKLGNIIDVFLGALIILTICSLIFGFIGDRFGKRKAEKKSHKDD